MKKKTFIVVFTFLLLVVYSYSQVLKPVKWDFYLEELGNNEYELVFEASIDKTWHDTAKAVVSNWMGIVYQVTHRDRRGIFMEGIDPLDPLELGW